MLNLFFYFIIFIFSFGQLARISFYDQQINFYLYEFFFGFFLFLLFFKYRFQPLKNFFKKNYSFFYFFLILFLSLINNFWHYSLFENFVGWLYFFRLVFYWVSFSYLKYWIEKEEKKDVIKKSLNIFIFITIITTTIQYFLYPDLRNLMYLGWDPHLQRTFGVFFDTSIAAAIYGLVFFLSSNFYIKIIYLFFLILSFSRAFYFSFVIALIYLYFKKHSSKKIIIFFIFLFLIFIVPKAPGEGGKLTRTFTIVSRINDYSQGFSLFLKKPILGYGYNRLRYVRELKTSHAGSSFSSSYLTILVSAGILGLLSIFKIMIEIWKREKNHKEIFLFLGVGAFFDNILFHPFIIFILGLLFILSRKL